MKILRTFLALAACAALLPLTPSASAGTGVGTSPTNATVDTTGGAGNVSVSMYRATKTVLANADASAGADDPLWVNAASPSALTTEPLAAGAAGTGGGLVADGVTPLIFRIAATSTPPAGGSRYVVSISPAWNWQASLSQPDEPTLAPAGSRVFSRSVEVILTSLQPQAFVVLRPIRSEDLQPTGLSGPSVARMKVVDAVTGVEKGALSFGISRPPIALVHGYNVTDKNWGDDFTPILEADRASGFVIPVGYGIEKDFNTTGSLWQLAATLNVELHAQVRLSPALNQWAWTRYDAVGHSQGGVLLRMLCSELDLAGSGGATVADLGFSPWRAGSNHYRGRFNRVVTIGSPHAGSTLAELGLKMRVERSPKVPYGNLFATVSNFNFFQFKKDLDHLFQPKFSVRAGGELASINSSLQCDPSARLHLLRTTIYNGKPPGEDGAGGNPLYYQALYLNAQSPLVNGKRPGLEVAPNAADGVVDVLSQGAGLGGNHTTAITGENIIHADIPYVPDEVPDTESQTVAERVAELLAAPASEFGPVTVPPTLTAARNAQAIEIAELVNKIGQELRLSAQTHFVLMLLNGENLVAVRGPKAGTSSFANETLNFTVEPPAGETVTGPVEWEASVYGPAGVTATGLTLVPSGPNNSQLALTVAADMVGQVVLCVRFSSSAGDVVIGAEGVVLNRPPGTTLTGITVAPTTIQSQAGAQVPLTVSAVYNGSVASSLFTNAANTTFQSSNPAVAAVDPTGRVALLALGTASITATYNGTLTATSAVTVLNVVPVVTSAASVSGTVGQAFSHQLTASQAVQTFAAAPLPPGLTLNAVSGLIGGTPTTQGATPALVSVTNANGTGSKQVDFVIAGPPGAPTDLGLDAAGVNSGKPVGTVVGRLVTVDPNPLDTFTYQLVTGTGSTNNGLFTISGDTLVTAAVINGAVTSTVAIRVRTTDSAAASFEKALVLPVGTPPVITRQPDARQAFAGESATFFVETTGLAPLQYQWKKSGADVAGATSRIFEVPAATPGDAGNYTVTVTNGDGSVTSTAASLAVNPISFGRWVAALPTGAQSALYEPLGDYNGDGVQNFLEFAFGVPPGVASGSGAKPVFSYDAVGPIFTYYRANGIEPLTYRVMKSGDLTAWTPHIPAPGDVTTIDHGSYTEVRVRVPWGDPKMFLQLEVSTE